MLHVQNEKSNIQSIKIHKYNINDGFRYMLQSCYIALPSKPKKSKEIKDEVEDTVNDEETTRLDKLKVGRKNYS